MATLRGKKNGDEQLREFLQTHRPVSIALIRTAITDNGYQLLADVHSLREVEVVMGSIGDVAVAKLLTRGTLRSLLIRQCPDVTNGALHSLNVTSGLRELYLEGTAVSSAGMVFVGKAACLTSVVVDNTEVRDEGIAHLSRLVNLHTLSMKGCPVSGYGVTKLHAAVALDIFLNKTHFTNEGAVALSCHCPKIKLLDVSDTRITDDGVRALSHITQLNDLRIANTDTTDLALACFYEHQNIESIDLRGTHVTQDGVDRLRLANRRIRMNVGPPLHVN